MSKESPQPQQSEEVDLGQLFKLIGNMFDRLFKFIGGVSYKLFLAFVWFVFFIKKHFIKLVIAGAVGTGLSVFLQKTSDPVYKSYITIKQNYNTGENLYNAIAYYNDLVGQNDIKTLKSVLEVDTLNLSSILGFDIKSIISENDKLKNYNNYLMILDSAVASTIDYRTYIENSKDYNHRYQQITIKSKDRQNFKIVFEKVVKNIESNEYFKQERYKDSIELDQEKQTLYKALEKSDSLQSTYKRVLENSLNTTKGSEIDITFEGASDKNSTKEFELYKNDLELRQRIVEIDRELADKSQIIETISSKQDSGSVDNRKELLGISISGKIYYGIIFTIFIFFVLLGLQFIKYLERFKDKI